MTKSIFDPNSGETEHSGDQNMGPQADDISQLPGHFRERKQLEDVQVEDDTIVDLGLKKPPVPAEKPEVKAARADDADET